MSAATSSANGTTHTPSPRRKRGNRLTGTIAEAPLPAKVQHLNPTELAASVERFRMESESSKHAGRFNGVQWAAHQASKVQLSNLARGVAFHRNPARFVQANEFGVVEAIEPRCEDFPAVSERILGSDWRYLTDDEDYMIGFVEGALEVWNAVEAQL